MHTLFSRRVLWRPSTTFPLLLSGSLLSLALTPLTAEETDTPPPTSASEVLVIHSAQQPSSTLTPDRQALDEDALRSSGGMTVLGREDLRQRKVSNMAEALGLVPGLYFNEATGSDGFFLSIRGSNLDRRTFSMNGVRITRDGLPLTYADGYTDGQVVDPQWAQHLVAQRGARALLSGGSGLGGAIDILMPTGYSADHTAQMRLEAGSFGHRALRGEIAHDDGRWDLWIGAASQQFDGFRDHSQASTNKAMASVGHRHGDWEHRLGIERLESDLELPGGLTRAQLEENRFQAQPQAIIGDYRRDVTVTGLSWRSSWTADDWQVVGGLSYHRSDLDHPIVNQVVILPFPGQVFAGLWVQREREDVQGSLRVTRHMGDQRLSLGLDSGWAAVKGTDAQNLDGVRGDVTSTIDDAARQHTLTVIHEWDLSEQWQLEAGAQLAYHKRRVGDLSADYWGISPRLGASYALWPSHRIFAGVGRLFEAPTLTQLADANDPDRALKAAEGWNAELGLRGREDLGPDQWFSYELTGFAAWLRREILAQEDPNAPGTLINDNADRTQRYGLEILLRGSQPISANGISLSTSLSYTYSRFHFVDDDRFDSNTLPAIPAHRFHGELSLNLPHGISTGPTVSAESYRWLDFANTEPAHGHVMMGWRAACELPLGATLWMEARNLFDRHWIGSTPIQGDSSSAAETPTFQAGEPRSFYAGMDWSF
ncbi:MAG: TonB-dependent receptor [Planctomycetota bacterium]|nr:MAG: TonB-dependent receptor [Planctomycetota bacterium]